jgi:hypothetical protein
MGELAANDPRHGTSRGYVLGCRLECCRRAQMVYMKRYRMGQTPKLIDPTGTIRRLQALACLGYGGKQIGEQVAKNLEWSRKLIRSQQITTTNAQLVADLYDRLSMTPATHPLAGRIRRDSAEKGWAPPLAWDDDSIDDPSARPYGGRDRRDGVDEVVVERLLAGDHVRATKAEKDEAMRRWVAMGNSRASLARMHGWKDGRYGRAA